jgi:transcription elongation factor Elf1
MRLHQQSAYTKQYGAKARAYNSGRAREMRDKFLEYKSALKCACCGETTSVCLDFHHRDPKQKDFGLSSFGTRSWELIKAEMDKCVVLCKNCHTKVHHGLIKLA